MKIIISSPSLSANQNVSGISSVTRFIIKNNRGNEYLHFELGKRDDENRNLFWFLRILKAYWKWGYLMSTQKDILVHFNLALSMPSIVRDSPLILFARLLRKRMIIHLHGGEFLMHKEAPLWLRYVLRLSLEGKYPKVVLSPVEAEALKHRFSISNAFVLENCVELGGARGFNRTYLGNHPLSVLFMGRITVDKGIESIFEAFKRLKEKGIEFKFIMAGKGREERVYVERFRGLLGEGFDYRGAVSGDEKAGLLKECDVFLLPSLFEGLPMALIESMAFGLVPIVTNVGSIRRVVTSGINGIIVNRDSSEEIVWAIKRLSQDREYLAKLGRNAREYIFRNYNPEAYIAKLNEIYKYA